MGNIERWDVGPLSRTDNQGRAGKARGDNRTPHSPHYNSRHSRQQASGKAARTELLTSSVPDRSKIERFAQDPSIQELVEDSRLAKGSVVSLVEDSHHDKRRKKLGKTTANLRNEPLKESKSSSKATPYRKSHSKLEPKLVEKVSHDVYIPTNITVANLARLLNIKHSTQTGFFAFFVVVSNSLRLPGVLQRRMGALGMANTDYDYSES